tara:strand:+ start:988 stop:1200 length:213 start_codon:yes stop_codon:yes gene_type:complete
MSLRTQLRNSKTVRGRRWIVKRNTDQTIREVKMIFKPEEYIKLKASKTMYGDKALLKILEENYEKKKNNS